MNQDTLLQIAKDYGSPVYVYDAHKMEVQYKRLTAAFSKVKHLKVNYAAKALTNISVLKFINNAIKIFLLCFILSFIKSI